MDTLLITSREIYQILKPALANKVVEKAFRAYGSGRADMPPKATLTLKRETCVQCPPISMVRGLMSQASKV